MATKTYKVHKEAEIFPLMPDSELEALAARIKKYGQRDPIELIDGKIIDGRNRCRACQIAGVEPETIDITDDMIGEDLADYVFDKNDARRHLTNTQRATSAAAYSQIKKVKSKAKKAMSEGGKGKVVPNGATINAKATAVAAKKFKVSTRSTERAAKVLKDGAAATKKAMEEDKLSVSKAETIAKLPKSKQPAAVKRTIQQSRKTSQNGGAKPTKKAMLRECEKAFDILYRTALKMGIDEKKYKKHFDAIIGEINRLGGEK